MTHAIAKYVRQFVQVVFGREQFRALNDGVNVREVNESHLGINRVHEGLFLLQLQAGNAQQNYLKN